MRTRLTLEDDVAVRLEQARMEAGLSLKEAVNRYLRAGLDHSEPPKPPREQYRIRPVSTGIPCVDLTRTSEIIVIDDEASWTQANG